MQWITNILLFSLAGILISAQSTNDVPLPAEHETTEPVSSENPITKYEDTTKFNVDVKAEEISLSSTTHALYLDTTDESASTIRAMEFTSTDSQTLSTMKSLLTSDSGRELPHNANKDDKNHGVSLLQNQSIDEQQPGNSSTFGNSIEDLNTTQLTTVESINSTLSSKGQVVLPTSEAEIMSTYSDDKINKNSEDQTHAAVKRHVPVEPQTSEKDVLSENNQVLMTENSTDPLITPTESVDVTQHETNQTEKSVMDTLENTKYTTENTLESSTKTTCEENNSTNNTDSSLHSDPVSTDSNEVLLGPAAANSSDAALTTNILDVSSTSLPNEISNISENTNFVHKPLSRGQRSSEFKPSEVILSLNNSVEKPLSEETSNSYVLVSSSSIEHSAMHEPLMNTEGSLAEPSPTAVNSENLSSSPFPLKHLITSTEINKELALVADNITENVVFLESTEQNASKPTDTLISTQRADSSTGTESTLENDHLSIPINSSFIPIENNSSENSAITVTKTENSVVLLSHPPAVRIPQNDESEPKALENSIKPAKNELNKNDDMEMMGDSPSRVDEAEISTESQAHGPKNKIPYELQKATTNESQLSYIQGENVSKETNVSAESSPKMNSKFIVLNAPLFASENNQHANDTKSPQSWQSAIPTIMSDNVVMLSKNETVVLLKATDDDSSSRNNTPAGQMFSDESYATDKVVVLREYPVDSYTPAPNQSEDVNVTEVPGNLTAAISLSSSTVATTTITSYRIRKPKIRLDGDSNTASAFLRRPTTTTKKPAAPKPEGRPVSIFNRNKTRINSITSSTTPGTTTRRNYQGYISNQPLRVAGTEVFSLSLLPLTTPTTTTRATTTTEAEEIEEEEEEVVELVEEHVPHPNQPPTFSDDDDVTLIKIAAATVVNKGLHWRKQLNTRTSPQFKEQKQRMHKTLERILRGSSVGTNLWKLEIDGFIETYPGSRSVVVDYSVYFVKTDNPIDEPLLVRAFNEKLVNNSFWRYTFDPAYTQFEILHEERLNEPTEPPETEPPIPQWAIAVIVIGAASFIFIVLFAAVTVYGRHHMRRRYASKLDDDLERSVDSKEWEKKMSGAAAYENLAADVVYDADDSGVENAKRKYIPPNPPRNPRMKHYDSWRTEWTVAPKRTRLPINHIIY